MAQGTSTSTPGMMRAAGILANTQGVAQNGVNSVDGALATLRSTWVGQTSTSFDVAMNKWLDDCYYIIGRLGDMIEMLDQNRNVIDSGEANNLAIANHIPTGPGLSI